MAKDCEVCGKTPKVGRILSHAHNVRARRFDFGVNAGPSRSVKRLQRALGVAEDGLVGPQTLDAARRASPGALVARLGELRLAYYQSLPGFPRFGAGWTARTHRAQAAALRMLA